MRCPHCDQEHPESTIFCPTTGRKIAGSRYCSNCGTEIQQAWKICPKCGTPVGEPAQLGTGVKTSQSKALPRLWIPILFSVLILALVAYLVFPRLGVSVGKTSPQVSREISASKGGEITSDDNTLVRIPPNSLPQDTEVSIRTTAADGVPALGAELVSVGNAQLINLGSDQLKESVTLEIPFDPALLPNDVNPDEVFLAYYDEGAKEWVYAGGQVDTSRNVIILETNHASWWMPTTWNWQAWIAVLNKTLQISIVNWIEAVKLLTASCSQTGNYVQVDSSQARNVVQGCIEQDDAEQPGLRIVNPKSFFFEVQPVSGGNGYPKQTLLAPGEDLKFKASTSDPAPLVIEASITQKSGWYLVVHMVITMLPGANQFGIQGKQVACITERLADVHYFADAAEALLVNKDGAAAAESLSRFMLDSEAVRRFITAADDCNFGPASTWSVEGISQIGGAVSTIMSATDYIANYFAGNTQSQVAFIWESRFTSSKPLGQIIYTSGQLGNQQLWLWDLSKAEPSLLASGAQVYGFAGTWVDGIVYGIASQVNGPFDVYLADDSGMNAILIASGVDQAFGGKSEDKSKILVRWIRGKTQGLDLINVASGQVQTLVQSAEFTGGWWMNSERNIAFTVRQNDRETLYIVDANLRQPPRLLAEEAQIFPMSFNNADYMVWENYNPPVEQSIHIFNPADGSSREVLRAPNIRWSILKDGDISFTLDQADGTEQYFLLHGADLKETGAQILDKSLDNEYFIYQKNSLQYFGMQFSNDFSPLVAGDMQVVWPRFTTDSQYVVYIAMARDQSQFAVFSIPTFGGESRELGRFTAPPGSSDPSRGVTTYSYPSGYALETSKGTTRGGFVVSSKSMSVLLYWSWLTGNRAGTYRIVFVEANGANNHVISEGTGVLLKQPQLTSDGQAVLATIQGSDSLSRLDLFQVDGTSKTLFSGASTISYQFTSDRHYAVIGVTTKNDGSKIYLLDLDTFTTKYLTDGIDPQLLDPYSLDGVQPWE